MKKKSGAVAAGTIAAILLGGTVTAAQAADGKALFQRDCAVCHDTAPGKNKLGPSLAGVVGRKSGSVADYSYSDAMQSANLTWDSATLERYLANPRAVVPGTKMLFLGVKDAGDRKALIDYLGTLKGGS